MIQYNFKPTENGIESTFNFSDIRHYGLLQANLRDLGIPSELAIFSSPDGIYSESFARMIINSSEEELNSALLDLAAVEIALINRGWHEHCGSYVAAVSRETAEKLWNNDGFVVKIGENDTIALVEFRGTAAELLRILESL